MHVRVRVRARVRGAVCQQHTQAPSVQRRVRARIARAAASSQAQQLAAPCKGRPSRALITPPKHSPPPVLPQMPTFCPGATSKLSALTTGGSTPGRYETDSCTAVMAPACGQPGGGEVSRGCCGVVEWPGAQKSPPAAAAAAAAAEDDDREEDSGGAAVAGASSGWSWYSTTRSTAR
jgi:hypothetical protein